MKKIELSKRGWWGLGCSLMVVAALGGCKQPETSGGTDGGSTPASDKPAVSGVGHAKPYTGKDILLGEYGSLTGTTATFGTSTRDGIKMAVDEANKAGGVLGKQIRIQLEDNQGKPEQAATVVKKLINQNNVLAVLGEVASSRSLAAAPICQAAGALRSKHGEGLESLKHPLQAQLQREQRLGVLLCQLESLLGGP